MGENPKQFEKTLFFMGLFSILCILSPHHCYYIIFCNGFSIKVVSWAFCNKGATCFALIMKYCAIKRYIMLQYLYHVVTAQKNTAQENKKKKKKKKTQKKKKKKKKKKKS